MLEAGTMLLFCAVLFASVALGWSIIPALFVGVLLFMGYGLVRRCSLRAMASRAAGSVRSAGTVVVAFVLIGVLTSLWRASGTIAFIVAHSTAVIHAATVIPLSFLLCSAMSVLVGSSFASAATMGTICMSLGLSMQANPVMLGGAILAGVYVGDRCSPVSTSALLVKQLTHTNLFNTIVRMLRTGAVPFVLSCVVYVAAAVVEWLCASGGSGFGAASAAATAGSAGSARAAVSTNASSITDIGGLFSSAFDLHWLTLVPALLVIVLALLRVDVRLLMLASIAASVAVCVGVQHMEWAELLRLLIFGYHAQNPQVAALLDGGGILSMLTVMATVCISSAYAGIFCRDADACSAAAGHRDARSSHRRMWCHHDYRDLRGGARLQPNPHHHAHSPVVRWAVRRRRIRTLRTSYRFGRQCRGDRSADSLVDRRCRAACHHQRAHTQPGRRDLPLPAAALADAHLGCTPPLGISDSASIPKSKPGTHHPTPAQTHAPHVRSWFPF